VFDEGFGRGWTLNRVIRIVYKWEVIFVLRILWDISHGYMYSEALVLDKLNGILDRDQIEVDYMYAAHIQCR
jgi:hypothetical protein